MRHTVTTRMSAAGKVAAASCIVSAFGLLKKAEHHCLITTHTKHLFNQTVRTIRGVGRGRRKTRLLPPNFGQRLLTHWVKMITNIIKPHLFW